MRPGSKLKVGIASKQRGATMVEYAIMVALIAIVAIGAVTTLGKATNNTFSKAGSAMGSVATG